MTLKSLWPVKPIRTVLHRQKAAAGCSASSESPNPNLFRPAIPDAHYRWATQKNGRTPREGSRSQRPQTHDDRGAHVGGACRGSLPGDVRRTTSSIEFLLALLPIAIWVCTPV